MEERKSGPIKLHNRIMLIMVAVFTAATSFATIINHKTDILYRENRKAASRPYLSFGTLIDGNYGEDLSSYINDRIPVRQFLIEAKCFIDEMILLKTEESGILIGKESKLFAKHFRGYGEDSLIDKNVDEIVRFAADSDIPVTVMIVPSAATVNPGMIPKYAPQRSEYEKMTEINNRLSKVCNAVDVFPILQEHNNEYIYYRNDHHWTTLGAYYAYTELAEHLGKDAASYDWSKSCSAGDFLGTHYAKSRYAKAIPDTIMYFPTDTDISIMKVVGDAEFEEERVVPLINTEKLNGYDKYAAFLDGNNGYSVISGEGSGSVLIVKDSFANCLIPLMENDFERIGIVDYRNYSYGLGNLTKKEKYDEILIIYSYAALETDGRLVYMNRPKE